MSSAEPAAPLLERLPIFPLPDVVLFPGALLPLHVFEPRYRALVRDCLAGDRRLALATLRPGYEADYEGRPPVHRIAGVGEVVEHQRHPDGRFDLLLRGLARVAILEELPPSQPYRLVRARKLADQPPADDGAAAASLAALRALCDRLAAALPIGGEDLRRLCRAHDAPGAAVDRVAAALVADPALRLRLLETLDVGARLDAALEAVAVLTSRVAGRGGPSA